MKFIAFLVLFFFIGLSTHKEQEMPRNPAIDVERFKVDVDAAMDLRRDRLVSEAEFQRMATQRETIVLDARSRDKFAMLHIDGAKNLPFTDFTVDSLASVIPSKSTNVLIYCNNNFRSLPEAFAAKLPSAALNLSTYTSLVTYGYTNVYELGVLVDPVATKLNLVGQSAGGN